MRMLDLISGRSSREEVADWAAPWIVQPSPSVADPVVWRALQQLSGADLLNWPGEEGEYLHSDVDFHGWLDQLETGDAS